MSPVIHGILVTSSIGILICSVGFEKTPELLSGLLAAVNITVKEGFGADIKKIKFRDKDLIIIPGRKYNELIVASLADPDDKSAEEITKSIIPLIEEVITEEDLELVTDEVQERITKLIKEKIWLEYKIVSLEELRQVAKRIFANLPQRIIININNRIESEHREANKTMIFKLDKLLKTQVSEKSMRSALDKLLEMDPYKVFPIVINLLKTNENPEIKLLLIKLYILSSTIGINEPLIKIDLIDRTISELANLEFPEKLDVIREFLFNELKVTRGLLCEENFSEWIKENEDRLLLVLSNVINEKRVIFAFLLISPYIVNSPKLLDVLIDIIGQKSEYIKEILVYLKTLHQIARTESKDFGIIEIRKLISRLKLSLIKAKENYYLANISRRSIERILSGLIKDYKIKLKLTSILLRLSCLIYGYNLIIHSDTLTGKEKIKILREIIYGYEKMIEETLSSDLGLPYKVYLNTYSKLINNLVYLYHIETEESAKEDAKNAIFKFSKDAFRMLWKLKCNGKITTGIFVRDGVILFSSFASIIEQKKDIGDELLILLKYLSDSETNIDENLVCHRTKKSYIEFAISSLSLLSKLVMLVESKTVREEILHTISNYLIQSSLYADKLEYIEKELIMNLFSAIKREIEVGNYEKVKPIVEIILKQAPELLKMLIK